MKTKKKSFIFFIYCLHFILFLSIDSPHASGDTIKKMPLHQAKDYLRPTQYGKGGGNVKDMLARLIDKWLSEKHNHPSNGPIDLHALIQNIFQGQKSFVDFISEDFENKNSMIPVWETSIFDQGHFKIIGLQTDGHHRTSAFVGEFLNIVEQENIDILYKKVATLLENIGRRVIDSGERISKNQIYQKPIILGIVVKNKNSPQQQTEDFKKVITAMAKNGKILPPPDRLYEWAQIKKRLSLQKDDPGYLSSQGLQEILWNEKGIIPKTFDELIDDPLRSFMGNFMFFSNLDSKHLVDYIEFRRNDQRILFGQKLVDTCGHKHFSIFNHKTKRYEILKTPNTINEKNWNDPQIKDLFMNCLFDTEKKSSQILTTWLKEEAVRLPADLTDKEMVKKTKKLTARMVDLANIIWLINKNNAVENRGKKICKIMANTPSFFDIREEQSHELLNQKRCDSLISFLQSKEEQQYMEKAIKDYQNILRNSETYRTTFFVPELDSKLESIGRLIGHTLELMDKQATRLYRKYLFEQKIKFLKENRQLCQNIKNSYDATIRVVDNGINPDIRVIFKVKSNGLIKEENLSIDDSKSKMERPLVLELQKKFTIFLKSLSLTQYEKFQEFRNMPLQDDRFFRPDSNSSFDLESVIKNQTLKKENKNFKSFEI